MQNDVLDFCLSADIVEGMVNKGIFLNGDNGGTFLHFGNYQNSCISDPTLCGPEGEWRLSYTYDYVAKTSSVSLCLFYIDADNV